MRRFNPSLHKRRLASRDLAASFYPLRLRTCCFVQVYEWSKIDLRDIGQSRSLHSNSYHTVVVMCLFTATRIGTQYLSVRKSKSGNSEAGR